MILVKLFSISVPLSILLQTESLDLKQAFSFANVTQNTLKDIRVNAIEEFSKIFKSVETYCNKIGIDVCIPRTLGRQAHRSNVAPNNPESYYHVTIFIPFLNNFIDQLHDRSYSTRI
jgi:hypothetical protein